MKMWVLKSSRPPAENKTGDGIRWIKVGRLHSVGGFSRNDLISMHIPDSYRRDEDDTGRVLIPNNPTTSNRVRIWQGVSEREDLLRVSQNITLDQFLWESTE